MSERSARVYMQVARGLPTLESKTAAAADLTLSEAVALLAEPKADPFEGMEPRERSPQTPAELVIWRFRQGGSIPGHDPYPEERLPDLFAPPIDIRRLPLASIKIEPDLEFRTEPRRLEDARWYAQIFEVLPPIAVFDIGGEYVLADGHYRIAAARLLGLKEIECRVYASDLTDKHRARRHIDMYGAAANCGGGLPYTMADYEHQLRMLREIGEIE